MKTGMINIYRCSSCNFAIVTKDIDEGVTPMFLDCRNYNFACNGAMRSRMYKVDQSHENTHEWYFPGKEELAGLDSDFRDHCEKGGLMLRKKQP